MNIVLVLGSQALLSTIWMLPAMRTVWNQVPKGIPSLILWQKN